MNKTRKLIIGLLLALTVIILYGCTYQLPTDLGEDQDISEDVIEEETDYIFEEEAPEEELTEEETITEEVIEEEPMDAAEEETEVLAEEDTAVAEEVTGAAVTETASPAEEVYASIPRKIVQEGDMVSFPKLKAVDADGDRITYSFTPPLDEKGKWQTKVNDAGEYKITITASDGVSTVSQDVIIVVNSSNHAPVMEKIGPVTVNEGSVVSFSPAVTDEDGDDTTITYSGWMNSATYKTAKDDAGTHTVIITASDGRAETSQEVAVTVNDINREPLVAALADIIAYEGDIVYLNVIAADPDGDDLSIRYSGTLFDRSGVWKTEVGDKGAYTVTTTVSDGKLSVSKTVKITVKEMNLPPVLDEIAAITVEEGDTVKIVATATDPENNKLTFTFSGWMTSGTRVTDYDDAGTHKVKVTVSDGVNKVSQDVKVTVKDQNQEPEFVGEWWS